MLLLHIMNIQELEKNEALLKEEARLVLYPIRHDKIFEMYKKQQKCFWTADELDFSKDHKDWEKMTSDELDGYYALNNTLDKELYNISIKYQRKLDEEFPNSDFAKYFSLNEDELQHFGTSFTFNNRYNKILKYLGLMEADLILLVELHLYRSHCIF